MNFYVKSLWHPPRAIAKLLLIMKLTVILIMAAILQVSATSFGQSVTLKVTNKPLKEVFSEIKKQTGLNILYRASDLKNSTAVSVNLVATPIDKAMELILVGQKLDFGITDINIAIKAKEESSFFDKIKEYFISIDVYGKVVDENGSPLGGATIVIKSSGKGISTKADGNFSISNIEEGTILTVSFMGYQSKEINAAKEVGTIKLEPSTSRLDEVQIQAYGQTTQRKSLSNITTIKADVIEKQNVSSPLLALQGRIPNLDINPANGLPNSGVTVRIQGRNSMLAGMDPLYVIDGVPYPSLTLPTGVSSPNGGSGSNANTLGIRGGNGNPLNFINPQDIESIDVLKDASATAIYGSRAANGAIIITTKKGKPGKMKLDLNLQNGRTMISRKVDVLNTDEYLTMRKEAFRNDNILPTSSNAYDILNLYGWSNARSTNWLDALLTKKAQYTTASLSVSGGTETSNYLISGTFNNQGVNLPGDFADRKASFHVNLGASSKDQRFKIQLNASYLHDQNLLPSIGADLPSSALTLAPTAPTIYNEDGTINWGINSSGSSTWGNPYAGLGNPYRNKTNNLVSALDLSYDLLKDLQLSLHTGFTTNSSREFSGTYFSTLPPEASPLQRSALYSNNEQSNWIVEPKLTYLRRLGPGWLKLLLGATINQSAGDGVSYFGNGFTSDNLIENISNAPNRGISLTANNQYKYVAAFTRLGYEIQNKYLLEFTGRRDGSSRFGVDNRFHDFGAIGLGWVFSEENFVKNNLTFLSFGKFRFSLGTTGNDQIADYSYLDLVGSQDVELPYQKISALQSTQLFNPVLQWEETTKTNFGIDLGFLNDQITLNVNYYKNNSSNTLNYLTLPLTVGIPTLVYNFDGKIQNSGWEMNLVTNNLKNSNIKWTTGIIFSTQRNKLVSPPSLPLGVTYVIDKPLNYDVNRFYTFAGIDPETGRSLYRTSQGGLTSNPNSNTDRSYQNLDPKWTGGLSNSVSFKGFQFDFFISAVEKKSRGYFGTSQSGGILSYNVPVVSLNRWQQPGDITFYRKFTTSAGNRDNFFSTSTGNIVDGSFIKLRSVSLSYDFPQQWIKKVNLQTLKIYTQAQNLAWLSRYQGYDPETGTTSPPTKIITLGLRASL